MVFQQGDLEPISKCSARLKKGEAAPGHIGQAKGLHQVLYERNVVEAALAKDTTRKSDREEQIMAALEEEGRSLSNNADHWNGKCGSCNEDLPVSLEGCDKGINKTDDSKRCLLMCTFCNNSYHPGCAGLCPTMRRFRDDWACPECVYLTEEKLQLSPVHQTPQQALKAANARLASSRTDAVESEAGRRTDIEPENKTSLAWMRWRMAREADFKNEMNMLQKLIRGRGHLCMFLPKFHCDLNWAENQWGKSKPCVRKCCDGEWMTLCKATWLSFGELNISEELSMRFARKIRETIMMYVHGVDGAFAIYCQRLFNMHRLPFFDASSLAKWQGGSPATTTVQRPKSTRAVALLKAGKYISVGWWAWTWTWTLEPAQ